jgi:hypothetical protein
MKSFLQFEKRAQGKELKTERWDVWTGGKNYDERGPQYAVLGDIHWWCNWRRYAFFPSDATLFDARCLREIADFCEKETKDYKAKAVKG